MHGVPRKARQQATGVPVVCRSSILLTPESSRVLIQPFDHGGEEKSRRIIERVMDLPEAEAEALLAEVMSEFVDRHVDFEGLLSGRFRQVRHFLPGDGEPSHTRRALIGAYFMSEFALESAAIFNPLIVPHPNQSGLGLDGACLFQ